jgi:tape measure domain-containing protein
MTTQTSRLVIEIDSRNAERNTRAVANELESLTTKGYKADAQMTEMSSSIKTLVGFMGGLLTINKAIAMADGYTQMAARIRNATSSAEEYDLVQNRVLATANTTYRTLGEAQEVYLSLSGGMKSLGKSTTQTLDLVDSLSFSFTHNATRTDQAQSAMDSLSKSMAKGKIDADAWISIVTGADNIIADMAKTTGKTEAEIRKLGAEGKASLDDLIKTMIATREQNEKLANNMENSLADGFTSLSNAVTVYLGKANESTSATGIMAGALGELAANLESVANVAMLGGVAYLTKTIIAQTVTIHGSIAASTAKKAALESEVVSQLKLLAVEVQRSRQTAAQTLTELNLARAELNSALTRTERAAATMRLTQAEVAHNIALKQSAAAVATQVTAESNLAAARTAGARALALVGGPVGAITIGVTALAAAYMLLSKNSQESTKSLRENNEAVGDAIVKYRELNSIQRDAQMAAERQKLEELNEAYRKASAELMVYASNMSDMGEFVSQSQVELSKLFAEYQKTGDLNAFNTAVQNSSKVSQDAKDKTANFAKAVFDAGSASKTQKEFIAQLSGELNGTANAGNNAAAGVRNLASALSEVNTKLSADVFSSKLQNAFEKQGKSSQSAARWTEVYNENAKNGFKGVTIEQKKMLDQLDAVDKQRETRQKASQAAASASAKASKAALAQQKKKAKDLERDTRQALEDAKSLIYEYTSEFTRIETDLKNEIEKINNSLLKSDSKTRMIADAAAISEAREKLYAAELDFELNEYKMSESQKLNAQTNIKKLRIDSTKGLLADERKLKKDSSDMESAQELGLIKLAKEQRIFQMQQGLMNANAQSERYWELERQRIELNVKDLDERNRQLAIAKALQAEEKQSNFSTAVKQWGSINADMTGTTEQFNLEKERFDRLDASQALFDAELALAGENYALKEQAYQAHADRMSAIEGEYQVSSMQLQLSYGESITNSMATIMKAMGGEQSRGYQVMYAISEGFAASQAALSLITNIAKASEIGFPQNIPMILGAMGQGAQIAAMLANIQAPTGYATGGLFTGNGHVRGPGTSTSDSINAKLSDYEFVTKASSVKKIGIENMEYMNRTGELPIQRAGGGLVTPKDTYRVGMGTVDAINRGADVQAERQAQANVRAQAQTPQIIDNQLRVLFVRDEDEAKDMLFGPNGEKAFLYHMKRNRSKI